MCIFDAPPQAAIDLLVRIDAELVAHRAERNLMTHLEATYELLVSWDAPEPVALDVAHLALHPSPRPFAAGPRPAGTT